MQPYYDYSTENKKNFNELVLNENKFVLKFDK